MKNLVFLLLFLSAKASAQSAASYISKGNVFYLELEFALAEAQYRQALDISPKNEEAKYNLANALMQQKKYKAAIEMYDGVTSSNKQSIRSSAYYNSGVAYSKQKDLPNSIEAYKAALRINPADKDARENLQKALTELKQQQQKNQQNKGGGGMNQNDADKKLKELEQKEKDLQKKMNNQGQNKGQGGGKDW